MTPGFTAVHASRLGGGTVREALLDAFVVLSLDGPKRVALLSARHQRELGYDFFDPS